MSRSNANPGSKTRRRSTITSRPAHAAHVDRLDQQVTEHPVRVRYAGLGDALHGILNDGRRGLPAKALVGGPDPAGELVGPFGGVRHHFVLSPTQRDDLIQQATVSAAFAYLAAMRDEKLPRKAKPAQ